MFYKDAEKTLNSLRDLGLKLEKISDTAQESGATELAKLFKDKYLNVLDMYFELQETIYN
jgi:hypothetical protein